MNEQHIKALMLSTLHRIFIMNNLVRDAWKQVTIIDGLVTATVKTGGRDCQHQPYTKNQWWNAMSNVSSWDWVMIKEADRVENHSNQFHIGCQKDCHIEQINDALWVVQWQVNSLPTITISSKISENEMNVLVDRLEDQFGRVVRAQTVI